MSNKRKFLFYVVTPVILLNIIVLIVYYSGNNRESEPETKIMNDSIKDNIMPIPVEKKKKDNKNIAAIYKAKILKDKSTPKQQKAESINDIFGDNQTGENEDPFSEKSTKDNNNDLRQNEPEKDKTYNQKQKDNQTGYNNISQKGKKNNTSGGSYKKKSYHPSSSSSKNKSEGKNNFDIPGLSNEKQEEEQKQTTTDNTGVRKRSGFTTVTKNNNTGTNSFAVNAVVQNDRREVKSGSTVKIRLKQSIKINGVTIPSNTLVSGIATLSTERVKIKINRILFNGKIYNCNYSVYDLDGIEGIYIPGGLNQDIAKQQANRQVGSTTVNVPLVGSISTNLGSKKIQDPSVKIPNGYKILLK